MTSAPLRRNIDIKSTKEGNCHCSLHSLYLRKYIVNGFRKDKIENCTVR